MSLSIYQQIARDSRDYQYKKQLDKRIKESEARKHKRPIKESTNVNITPDGAVNVSVDNAAPIVPEVIEPEVEVTDEVIEEGCSKKEEEVKEGCSKDEEVKEGCSKEVEETEDEKKSITTESEEEIGKDVIDTVVAKLSLEDEELANKVKELLSKEPEVEVPEEVEDTEVSEEIEEEPLEECEITSYTVTRVAPTSKVYMLEAQTKDGLRFITGRNFDEKNKTLDEAEIADTKSAASERFRKLMRGE